MSKNFSSDEHRILNLFKVNNSFILNNNKYTILNSGKPTCASGEPKTDIYVLAESKGNKIEIKISYKKDNADFLENKISAERAEQIFGDNWSDIIINSTSKLKKEFSSRPLIYLEKANHTEAGSITLGWKFELLNVKSGLLSEKLPLTKKQVINVYAGTNLSKDKKDANVNGQNIKNSGIANFMLVEDKPIKTLQNAIDKIVTIEDYVKENPNIYFACKALNYRTFKLKYDGDRPLAVSIHWFVNNDSKLDYKFIFTSPLKFGGNITAFKLANAMSQLGITNTTELNINNLSSRIIIIGKLPQ